MIATFDLGPLDRIARGEGRTFDLGFLRIAVFRARGGEIYATQAQCPHKEGPLADGLLGGGCIICPLHGFKFDLATGAPVGNTCPPIATYDISVDGDGLIKVRVPIEPASKTTRRLHFLEP